MKKEQEKWKGNKRPRKTWNREIKLTLEKGEEWIKGKDGKKNIINLNWTIQTEKIKGINN